MTEPWLVYFAVFGAVFLIIQFGFLFVSRDVSTRRRVNQRLADIDAGRYSPVTPTLRRSTPGSMIGPFTGLLRLYAQAGGRNALLPVAFVASAVFLLTLILLMTSGHGVAAPFLAIGLAFGVAFLTLTIMRTRRIGAFGEQFPDMLDIVVRSLRAGHPITVALGLVAREMQDPMGSEIGLVTDEVAYGRDLPSALENLLDRVGYEELRFFTTAVSIQSQTGGNLGEILTRLSALLRDRFRMKRKVRSLSAEGRLSAYFLSAFPFLLFGAISLISPAYYGDVWTNPLFEACMYVSAVLLIIGNVIIFRMINFKV
ncbi:type II secretion system F family protein [Alsobacter sp. R-9]